MRNGVVSSNSDVLSIGSSDPCDSRFDSCDIKSPPLLSDQKSPLIGVWDQREAPIATISAISRRICCSSKIPFLPPRKSERCVTTIGISTDSAPSQVRRNLSTSSRIVPSCNFSFSSRAHLHTPRQTAALGWVSLLSGRLCQQLLFCSCHVEPVFRQLQAPI